MCSRITNLIARAYKVQSVNLTVQTVQNYKSWRQVLWEMRRLVTLLMLRSPKF